MSTAYVEEEGFDVVDDFEVGDLSDQQGGVLDPAQRIGFEIKRATVRTTEDKETGNWMVRRLSLEAAIGPLGTDGEGKYAGKRLFPEFILTFNAADFPEKYNKDWWKRQARYPTKQLFKALGIDITAVRVRSEE